MKVSRTHLMAFVIALLALVAGAMLATRHYRAPASVPVGALFDLTFDDVDGRPQPLRQWQGRVLVINFWATWCAPCVEEMPELQAVHSDYVERGVTVVGLAIDNANAAKQFRDRMQLQLPLLLAGASGNELARQLGNATGALPYTVLIDQRSQFVRAKLGRIREPELRVWLDALIK